MTHLAAATTAASTAGSDLWEYLLLFAVVVGVMLLTTILPQRRRDRETKQTLDKVRRGARVLTRGGIYGMVTDVQEDQVVVRIADKVEVRMTKSAISDVLRSADEPQPEGGATTAGNGRKGRRSS